MFHSVLIYGCDVWTMREEDNRWLTAVEMDYLPRSGRISRLDRIRNEGGIEYQHQKQLWIASKREVSYGLAI